MDRQKIAVLGGPSSAFEVNRALANRLTAALGGNANVPGFYWTQQGVKAVGSVVGVWDDVRCSTTQGRYYVPGVSGEYVDAGVYAGLSGAQKASWLFVGSPTSLAANAVLAAAFNTQGWYAHLVATTGAVYLATDSAHGATYTWAASLNQGDLVAVAISYDGTQALGSRVKVYGASYAPSTATWASLSALTLSADTAGSTIGTSDGDLMMGARGTGTTSNFTGMLDDIRIFENVALTQAQFQNELNAFVAKSGTSPNGASKWYSFDGNANNLGTVPGNNGTPTSNVVLCSDDCRWGPALASAGTNRPAWGSGLVTFDGVNDYLRGFQGRLGDITASCALGVVTKNPALPAGSAHVANLYSDTGIGYYIIRTPSGVYQAGTALFSVSTTAGPDGVLGTLHGWRVQSGGNSTDYLQIGGNASVQSTAADAAVSPTIATIGASGDSTPSGFASPAMRAMVLYTGDYSGKQTLVNQWAQQYCGATL